MKDDTNRPKRHRAALKKKAAASPARAERLKSKASLGKGMATPARGSGAKSSRKNVRKIKNKLRDRLAKSPKLRTTNATGRPGPGKKMTTRLPNGNVGRRKVDTDPTRMLAAIVQSSDTAIIGKTLDGIVTSWNPGAESIFGYTESEMIGEPIRVIAAPGRRKEMTQILNRVGRGKRVEHLETERMRKDGRIVPISLTVLPVLDGRGRIIGASKIVRDITDQRRTEAELKSKSERLEEFMHALNLAPAMMRTLEGKILLWGPGLQAVFGWSPGEAIGRIAHNLLATNFPQPLSEIQTEMLKEGEWHGELEHTHKDGHRMVVASHWALHRHANGDPVSVLESYLDVTEARRSRSMIEEREARLRSVLETAPDAIITIDERGIIQSFSTAAEKLFAYAAGEVIGRNVKMLMPAPHAENHDGYLARYLQTGEKRIIGIGRQVEARRKDGTIFPMELAVGEVKLGTARLFTAFIRDLTARVKMEQDLRQAQKMEAIGQLTGGIAHDFNNLLTVIAGNLEMLERRLEDVEDREILNEAQEASQLGAQLTKRLLAFGRRQSLNPKPVDLNALVDGMVDLMRRSLGATVEIEVRLAEKLPMIMVDPGQVENALLNLSVNARDAMPQGGRLVIETARSVIDEDYAATYGDALPGSYVTLAVTDTGTGMSAEVRHRAFEPFFTTKGPGAGSGLGLSMVYGFVKQSGGHVQLYSEVGLGTTVRLYLPAQNDDVGTAARRDATTLARAASGETVLVVDDDPRGRRVSLRRLKELGYVALEAESGPAALKILDEGRPIDLLFTDIAMPGGMTGVDLAHEARRRRPALKILFTSGYADPAVVKGGLLTTNAGWLDKPHSMNDLRAKLGELLGR